MKKLFKFFVLFVPVLIFAQTSTSSDEIIKGLSLQNELIKNSIVKNIKFQNIGPSVMSGRVSDIEVNPNNPKEFYVAYASGGLWHTVNNGNTFVSVFENADTQNIGDFAVDWTTGLIIVGTGENNSSRSS